MKPPLFIRPLTDDERRQLEAARRTTDAFESAKYRGEPLSGLMLCATLSA